MTRLLDRLAEWWIRRSFDRWLEEGTPVEVVTLRNRTATTGAAKNFVFDYDHPSGEFFCSPNVSTVTAQTNLEES